MHRDSTKSFFAPRITTSLKIDDFNLANNEVFQPPTEHAEENSIHSEEKIDSLETSLGKDTEGVRETNLTKDMNLFGCKNSNQKTFSVEQAVIKKRSLSNLDEFPSLTESLSSKNSVASSQDFKLKNEKKKVIHLDIPQYRPRRLSNRDRADICRKINTQGFFNKELNEQEFRKMSLVKQDLGENEVVAWFDFFKQNSDERFQIEIS